MEPRAGPASRAPTGFTLIEVMVAMIVLAATTLGLVQLAATATLLARNSVAATELSTLAQNALEAARDRGYEGNAPGVSADTMDVRGRSYARRLTVTDQGPRTREIRVDMQRVGAAVPDYSTLVYVLR